MVDSRWPWSLPARDRRRDLEAQPVPPLRPVSLERGSSRLSPHSSAGLEILSVQGSGHGCSGLYGVGVYPRRKKTHGRTPPTNDACVRRSMVVPAASMSSRRAAPLAQKSVNSCGRTQSGCSSLPCPRAASGRCRYPPNRPRSADDQELAERLGLHALLPWRDAGGPVTLWATSRQVTPHCRATVDEDGHYCFAVAL